MAVEIPVYVDIKGGIDRAVSELPNDIKSLERAVGKNALNLRFDIDKHGFDASLRDLLTSTRYTTKELHTALSNVRAEFEDAMSRNAGQKRVTAEVNNLIRAYTALEQRLYGTKNNFTASMMSTENAISRVKAKIQDLTNQRSGFTQYDTQWQNLTYQIRMQEEKLSRLNTQFEVYRIKSKEAGKSAKTSALEANSAYSTQLGLIQQLTGALASYVSIYGLTRFAKQIRDVTGELEYQRVALGRLIQDEEYGAQLFEKIKAAAVESPFRIKDLVTYTKQLAAYKIEQEDLFDVTKKLADISAGLGVDMNRIILAYGQVRAASVLRGQELRQFTEAGIPLVELLAEKFTELRGETVKTSEVFKLISQRAVPFSMIADIFDDLTEKGGMFYQMQEKQAKTLQGRWEKLKDTYDIALQSIGETETFQRANDKVLASLNALAKHLNVIPKALSAITTAAISYVAVMKMIDLWNKRFLIQEGLIKAGLVLRAVLAKKVTLAEVARLAQTKMLAKAEAKLAVATNAASRAVAKLTIALLTNPWVAAIAAVAGLIAMFVSFGKTTDETADSVAALDKTIDEFHQETKKLSKLDKLIDNYEALAKKTERTEAETRKLSKTIKTLQDAYPGLTFSIDDDTKSIDENTKAMRDHNKERMKNARKKAEDDLGLSKVNLKNYEKERERINAKYLEKRRDMLLYDDETGSRREMTKLEEKAYNKLTKEANELRSQIDALDEEIESTTHDIERLEAQLYPKEDVSEAWRDQLKSMQLASDGSEIFSNEQLDGWTRLYDVSNDLEKEWKKVKEELDAMRESADKAGPKFIEEWAKDIENLESRLAGLELIKEFFKFTWGKQTHTHASYQQDPFIQQMQDRMKFMQDFKKGYDDLVKHMSANEALFREGGIMEARGLSLGIDTKEQARAADDLSNWYSDALEKAFQEAKKHGAKGNTVEEFLSQQIKDTTNKGKALRDFQKLMQSIWDAKTDFDTSKLKKELEDAFKRLTEDIKRSETVRNFYQNILDLTGDQNLAATMSVSVYGDIGNDFKENLQRQLNHTLESLDASKITEDLKRAFESMDFDTILKNIDKFTEDQQKTLRELASQYEKYNADIAIDLIKSLQDAKTYSEKRVELAMQTAKRLEQINELNVPEETKAQLRKQNVKKEAEETAKLQYEAFNDSPMYVELFANLDRASSTMLRNMRDNLISMKSAWKDLPATDLKEMQSRIDELNSQLATKNPFRELIDSITAYRELTKKQSRQEADATAAALSERANLEKELLDIATEDWKIAKEKYGINSEEELLARDKMEVQKEETDLAEEEAKAAQETAKAHREIAQWIQDASEGLQKWAGYVNDAVGNVNEIVSAFASDDFAETFKILSDGLTKTLSGAAKIGAGLGKGLAGIPDIISGITDVVVGIGLAIQGINLKKINKQIKEQQEKIDALERSYERLDKAMAKAFGSDYIYNYNKQLDALQAKIDAYNEQARLEESKGKKTDADKVKEYRESAEDAAEQIADMQGQLAEYFAGTDLTSAAKDFANSWIEAYKEFGSTTDSMKEKFQDMIQSMVEQSLGAKIMQSILQPLFDSIDAMAASGGELSAQEIAQIAKSAPEYIDQINNAMTNLMNQLSAAGYNVRQGMGQFTGISRDIANASEESITGLAAGINTQNFYMSLISQNVGAILAVMTGSSDVSGAAGAAAPEDPYKKQMLEFVGALPQMRDDMAAMRSMMEKVIRPNGTSAQYYVATRS